jgi:tripartite-type tricarboxylate transporter receptor subunit TctC
MRASERVRLWVLIAAVFATGAALAQAQQKFPAKPAPAALAAYPERPLRYVIPSAAGGGPDTAARVVMAELGKRLGQQIVVDNRPGASGMIGTELIAKAAPDGYTIGHGNIATLGINRSVLKLPYNLDRDIEPVVQMYFTPNLLAVSQSLPVKSVGELINHARKNPGQLFYASTGSGTSIHLSSELFQLSTGTKMVHVPFKAAALAIVDLTAGRVHLMFDNINSVGPHVKAGKVRGLAVTSSKKVAAFPDLPTVAEAGVEGFDVVAWAGVIVPARVSRTIVDRLNKEVNAVLTTRAVVEKLRAQGLEVVGGTPAEFARHVKKEAARWADVVKRAGIKVD